MANPGRTAATEGGAAQRPREAGAVDRHAIRRWPSPRAREWTTAFLDTVQDDPNVLAVVAVGSAVRPGVPSTDLDLVVVCVDCARLARDCATTRASGQVSERTGDDAPASAW